METILHQGFINLVEKLRLWIKSFCEVDIPTYKQNKYQQYRHEDVFVGEQNKKRKKFYSKLCDFFFKATMMMQSQG